MGKGVKLSGGTKQIPKATGSVSKPVKISNEASGYLTKKTTPKPKLKGGGNIKGCPPFCGGGKIKK
jgi:hypothetical protein